MSAQKIPTEQKIPVDEEEEENIENYDGEEPICFIIPKLIIEPMKDLSNRLANLKKEIDVMYTKLNQILIDAEEGQEDLMRQFQYEHEKFSKLEEAYSKLKNSEKNQYMILVRTENHPLDQVEVFIASPKMHSFQSHQAGKYSKKFVIKEKYVSAALYPKIQAELKSCSFISSWNDRSKSFWCKKDRLEDVMTIIRYNIAEFRILDQNRCLLELRKSSGEQ